MCDCSSIQEHGHSAYEPFDLEGADTWSEKFPDWRDPATQSGVRIFAPSEGWVWLQGDSRVTGKLVGGCLDVLEFLKGTEWWIPRRARTICAGRSKMTRSKRSFRQLVATNRAASYRT